jgi:hypothetical protein
MCNLNLLFPLLLLAYNMYGSSVTHLIKPRHARRKTSQDPQQQTTVAFSVRSIEQSLWPCWNCYCPIRHNTWRWALFPSALSFPFCYIGRQIFNMFSQPITTYWYCTWVHRRRKLTKFRAPVFQPTICDCVYNSATVVHCVPNRESIQKGGSRTRCGPTELNKISKYQRWWLCPVYCSMCWMSNGSFICKNNSHAIKNVQPGTIQEHFVPGMNQSGA